MKYHAKLTNDAGLNALPINPCKLLDFNFLKLEAGESFSVSSGGREILAVILGGKAMITVADKDFGASGYTTYYLWFLSDNQRTQATVNDPVLGWVGDTVPPLWKMGL